MISDPAAERLLRWALACVWLATGILVLHPAYRSEGTDWLARLGLGPEWMLGACAGEVILAAILFARRTNPWLALLQGGAIVGFTIILAALSPRLLVHPLGVLSKNLPLLAAIATAWLLVGEGFSQRAQWILRIGMAAPWISEGLFPKLLFLQPMEIEIVSFWGFSATSAGVLIRLVGVAQLLSGVAALLLRGRPLAWLLGAQLVALALLPIVVTVPLPLAWVHPFGPLTKNVVLLAGTFVLFRRCTPTSS